MSYYSDVCNQLNLRTDSLPTNSWRKFHDLYKEACIKIDNSNTLFRVMSEEECISCRKYCNHDEGGELQMDTNLIEKWSSINYARTWFSLDRPYRFSRQIANFKNNPYRNINNTYKGTEFMMITKMEQKHKDYLKYFLLPDYKTKEIERLLKKMTSRYGKFSGTGRLIKKVNESSCRCKNEGGVITLALSKTALTTVFRDMKVKKLGFRLTPTNKHDQFTNEVGRLSMMNPCF